MKICIFTHTFPRFPGDTAAPFMGILAEALTKHGHKVFVLTPFDIKIKKNLKRPYRLLTYKYIFPDSLHTLGYSRTMQDDKKLSLRSYLLSPFLYFFGFFALLRFVRREKIDVISSHWIIPNGFITSLVSKITKTPFTTTIPGSDVYMGGKNIFFRWMVGYAANNASYVLSDSIHYLKQLGDLGFFPKKTQVIRYGVNTTKFRATEKDREILKKLSVPLDDPVILAVGRMVAKKGFKYLIDAMPKVLKKIPNRHLVIVGDGDQRKELEEKVKKYKIEKNVIFPGMISYNELSKYYNIADVFVMPSIRDEKGNIDASPVSMMEAMATGTRIVATRFAGGEDLVEKGKTGFLVREKDSKIIADSIISLIGTSGTSNKTKSIVRKIAVENFSSEIVAKKYQNIFNEVL